MLSYGELRLSNGDDGITLATNSSFIPNPMTSYWSKGSKGWVLKEWELGCLVIGVGI